MHCIMRDKKFSSKIQFNINEITCLHVHKLQFTITIGPFTSEEPRTQPDKKKKQQQRGWACILSLCGHVHGRDARGSCGQRWRGKDQWCRDGWAFKGSRPKFGHVSGIYTMLEGVLQQVGSQYDTRPYVALHHLHTEQCNAKIDLESILAFRVLCPCVRLQIGFS